MTCNGIAQEVANGEGLYLAEAARLFPAHRQGKRVSPSTVFRWASKGVSLEGGHVVRLETARLAGKLVTTKAAIARFIEAQAAQQEPPPPAAQMPAYSRVAEHEAAERELERDGF